MAVLTLSGTATANICQSDLLRGAPLSSVGNIELTYTLDNTDTFISPWTNTERTALLTQLSTASDKSATNGFNAMVLANMTVANVGTPFNGDRSITVTIPAYAAYDMRTGETFPYKETVTVIAPASVVTSAVASDPADFTIANRAYQFKLWGDSQFVCEGVSVAGDWPNPWNTNINPISQTNLQIAIAGSNYWDGINHREVNAATGDLGAEVPFSVLGVAHYGAGNFFVSKAAQSGARIDETGFGDLSPERWRSAPISSTLMSGADDAEASAADILDPGGQAFEELQPLRSIWAGENDASSAAGLNGSSGAAARFIRNMYNIDATLLEWSGGVDEPEWWFKPYMPLQGVFAGDTYGSHHEDVQLAIDYVHQTLSAERGCYRWATFTNDQTTEVVADGIHLTGQGICNVVDRGFTQLLDAYDEAGGELSALWDGSVSAVSAIPTMGLASQVTPLITGGAVYSGAEVNAFSWDANGGDDVVWYLLGNNNVETALGNVASATTSSLVDDLNRVPRLFWGQRLRAEYRDPVLGYCADQHFYTYVKPSTPVLDSYNPRQLLFGVNGAVFSDQDAGEMTDIANDNTNFVYNWQPDTVLQSRGGSCFNAGSIITSGATDADTTNNVPQAGDWTRILMIKPYSASNVDPADQQALYGAGQGFLNSQMFLALRANTVTDRNDIQLLADESQFVSWNIVINAGDQWDSADLMICSMRYDSSANTVYLSYRDSVGNRIEANAAPSAALSSTTNVSDSLGNNPGRFSALFEQQFTFAEETFVSNADLDDIFEELAQRGLESSLLLFNNNLGGF